MSSSDLSPHPLLHWTSTCLLTSAFYTHQPFPLWLINPFKPASVSAFGFWPDSEDKSQRSNKIFGNCSLKSKVSKLNFIVCVDCQMDKWHYIPRWSLGNSYTVGYFFNIIISTTYLVITRDWQSSPAVAAVTMSPVPLWLCHPAVIGWRGHQNHVEVIFIKTSFHLPGLLWSCSITVGKEWEDFFSLTGGSLCGGDSQSLSALYLSVYCASILPASNSPCRSETINVSVAQSNIYCVKHPLIPFMPSASPS